MKNIWGSDRELAYVIGYLPQLGGGNSSLIEYDFESVTHNFETLDVHLKSKGYCLTDEAEYGLVYSNDDWENAVITKFKVRD